MTFQLLTTLEKCCLIRDIARSRWFWLAKQIQIHCTTAIKLTGVSGSFSGTMKKITQSSTGAVGKVIEWDSTNAILYFVQSRHSNEGVRRKRNQVAFSGSGQVGGEGGTPLV